MTARADVEACAEELASDTRRLIAEINDEGRFEQLAASTLRIAEPLYRGICETGTNARGRTIADPADGIVYAESVDGERYAIIVHHTITERKGLRAKWLYPERGDVAKAAALFECSGGELDDYKRRLVLTCSTGPDSALVTDLEAAGVSNKISIDVWSGGRLADVLDLNPDGQWLRAREFGTRQQRLSRALACEIGAKMVEAARPQADPAEFIKRNLRTTIDDRLGSSGNILFLTGRSGVGKSVFCYELAKDLERSGGVCLVLTDRVIHEATTLEEALSRSLKAYAPALREADLQAALLSCCAPHDVFVWIEDLNRAAAPADLVRKLLRWMRDPVPSSQDGAQANRPTRGIKVLCPIWPDILAGLCRSEREAIDCDAILLDEFSHSEGGKAVLRRAASAGIGVTELQAQEIAEQLNHDPLFIGLLSDWRAPRPAEIVGQYVEDELAKTASKCTYRKSELEGTLRQFVGSMLQARDISPAWARALSWMPSESDASKLRILVRDASLVHVNDADEVGFRHDRVRDFLLSAFISGKMSVNELDSDLAFDPFFARVVGEAALLASDADVVRDRAKGIGPLAKAHAFAAAVRQNHFARNDLYLACKDTLVSEAVQKGPQSQRFAINVVLAQLDGDDVLDLLRISSENCFARQEGLARNGDVRAAAAFCYTHDPYVNSPRRDRILAHAVKRLGLSWINNIGSLIVDPDVDEKILEGALFLAGELGREELIGPLKTRWALIAEAESELTSGMLYAAIACAAGRDNRFADDVASVWAALPSEDPDREHRHPRVDVAQYGLGGGLWRHETDRVVGYLLGLSERFPALTSTIAWLMRVVDHPDAVRHVAEAVAEIDRRCEGTDSFNVWATSFADHWGRRRERHTRKMSDVSRGALRDVWAKTGNDLWSRKRAFDLWSAWMSSEDIRDLSENPPDGLEDRALAARLRHGDQTAKPDLATRILKEDNDWYWLQFARYVGTGGLERVVSLLFERRRAFFVKEPDGYYLPDNILPEVLGDRDDEFSVRAILENWDQVQAKSNYVIALLYLATPESLTIAEKAIKESEDPAKLLQFIDSRLGIKTVSRPGLKRLEQVQALLPYFDCFSDLAKWTIWEACNDRGWYEWRKRHLDAKVDWPEDRVFPRINEDADFDWLDSQLEGGRRFRAEAHYWAKDRLECGMTSGQLIERAERYASSRRTVDAYKFFADVISELGARTDLSRLRMDWAMCQPKLATKNADATFAVQLRRCD